MLVLDAQLAFGKLLHTENGLVEPPVDGKKEILDIFIESRSLNIGFIELRNLRRFKSKDGSEEHCMCKKNMSYPKALVDYNTIADNGTKIGNSVPVSQIRRIECEYT